MHETVEAIWARGRRAAPRAIAGGRRRPVTSYQAVLLYLRAAGPSTATRLAHALATSERRIGVRTTALWEYGFVAGTGTPSRWALTEDGHRLVDALRREALGNR